MRKWLAALALLLGALGVFGFVRAGSGLSERSLVVDGVPLYETWDPSYTGQRSGVVVAHGFSGSAQLMKPWAETFARQGFMVVSLDFSGHGRNTGFLTHAAHLEDEVDVAVRHLNSLGIEPVALLGHSMGADAVVRYAAAHNAPVIGLSLPDPPSPPPAHLQLYVGQLELSGFHHSGATSIPWADHVTILYSSRAHSEAARWLSPTLDEPRPVPLNRLIPGALLIVAFTVGLAALPRRVVLPSRDDPPGSVAQPQSGVQPQGVFVPRRVSLSWHSAMVVVYSLAAVAIPVHFGMTNVWPTGWRWLLIPVVIAGSAAFGFALQFVAKGRFWIHLGLSMIVPLGLAALGGFLFIIAPLVALLLLWQSIWVRLLNNYSASPWLPPLAGSLLVAIPFAAAVPLLGP